MTQPFPVEKEIPIPPRRNEFTGMIEVLRSMSVGDSFFWPMLNSAMASARLHNPANRLGIKLTMRKEGNGVRVWRIA